MSDTQFLNIDLDLESKHDIRPLAEAWGEDVFTFRLDNDDGIWRGSFETMEDDAEKIIDKYYQLVTGLSPALRELWDSASQRIFDIGFEAGSDPRVFQAHLSDQAVAKIHSIGGSLTVTIYANSDD